MEKAIAVVLLAIASVLILYWIISKSKKRKAFLVVLGFIALVSSMIGDLTGIIADLFPGFLHPTPVTTAIISGYFMTPTSTANTQFTEVFPDVRRMVVAADAQIAVISPGAQLIEIVSDGINRQDVETFRYNSAPLLSGWRLLYRKENDEPPGLELTLNSNGYFEVRSLSLSDVHAAQRPLSKWVVDILRIDNVAEESQASLIDGEIYSLSMISINGVDRPVWSVPYQLPGNPSFLIDAATGQPLCREGEILAHGKCVVMNKTLYLWSVPLEWRIQLSGIMLSCLCLALVSCGPLNPTVQPVPTPLPTSLPECYLSTSFGEIDCDTCKDFPPPEFTALAVSEKLVDIVPQVKGADLVDVYASCIDLYRIPNDPNEKAFPVVNGWLYRYRLAGRIIVVNVISNGVVSTEQQTASDFDLKSQAITGWSFDSDEVSALADRHGLPLREDAAIFRVHMWLINGVSRPVWTVPYALGGGMLFLVDASTGQVLCPLSENGEFAECVVDNEIKKQPASTMVTATPEAFNIQCRSSRKTPVLSG